MLKATVKGNCKADSSGAAGTFTVNGSDVKLRAAVTEATFTAGPSLSGLCLSVEKPGSFIVDYNLHKQDLRFHFMNSVRALEKELKVAYTHWRRENRVALDGTLVIDLANKFSANYAFDTGNCKLKYSYTQGGVRTFEPCYDVSKNSWDFAVLQRIYGDDVLKASYQTSSKVLGLEWLRASPFSGSFKQVIILVPHEASLATHLVQVTACTGLGYPTYCQVVTEIQMPQQDACWLSYACCWLDFEHRINVKGK